MRVSQIRQVFIDYFKSKGHEFVPSSSLLPKNDKSIMFTNAGMNQFKDVFMGLDSRSYTRATSVQRCVRAGGKHNDLDMVGKTARHHTFFEMLGNFSFGDYFKKEAIAMAWELLTEKFKLDTSRLYITVHESDQEAYDIWHKEIGIPEHKIYKMGDKDNFWSMGDTGPCGPSSEIFYDHGKEYACSETCDVGCDCDRFVEIWNLVFMQYNRKKDGSLEPLPKKNVDTGAGIERLAAVLQNKVSNYDIELFVQIKRHISEVLGVKETLNKVAFNVIADHIRSISFLIMDGLIPSNEGAGYVLRRIIRRAVRYGKILGANEPFLYKLVKPLGTLMGDFYPELIDTTQHIEKVIRQEESSFHKTLDNGLKLIEEQLSATKNLSPDFVFKLYDTYGFPIDLTRIILEEKGVSFDESSVLKLMEKQKEQSRAHKKFANKTIDDIGQRLIEQNIPTTVFKGYETLSLDAKMLFMEVLNDKEALVVFDKTPFYAESGGQIADTGTILLNDRIVAKVQDVKKSVNNIFLHHIALLENLDTTKNYTLSVDGLRRKSIAINHTATHLLQALLRKHLGKHVKQAGSLVSDKVLRFDFTHTELVNSETLKAIELELNKIIFAGYDVITTEEDYNDAIKKGVMALFDEKYDKFVRVVRVGDISQELCGGTHVKNTEQIGIFKIVSQSTIASGTRRIEAKTGLEAYRYIANELNVIEDISAIFNTPTKNLINTVKKQESLIKEYEASLREYKKKNLAVEIQTLLNKAKDFNGIYFVFAVRTMESKELKDFIATIRGQLKRRIVVLIAVREKAASLSIDIDKETSKLIGARELFELIAKEMGFKGGGSNEFIQAGGGKTSIPKELETKLSDFIKAKLEA